MLKRMFCITAAIFMGSSAGAQSTDTPSVISLIEVRTSALDKRVIILDVREQSEWDKGHLKLAKLVPLSALRDGEAVLEDVPKNVPVYCHCKAGIRAKYAADMLNKLGYDATALEMSYKEIIDSGFEETTD